MGNTNHLLNFHIFANMAHIQKKKKKDVEKSTGPRKVLWKQKYKLIKYNSKLKKKHF